MSKEKGTFLAQKTSLGTILAYCASSIYLKEIRGDTKRTGLEIIYTYIHMYVCVCIFFLFYFLVVVETMFYSITQTGVQRYNLR